MFSPCTIYCMHAIRKLQLPISPVRLSASPTSSKVIFSKSRSDFTCRLEYVETPPLSRLLSVVRQLHLFQVLSVRSLVLDLAHVRLETKRIIVSLKPHHRDGSTFT